MGEAEGSGNPAPQPGEDEALKQRKQALVAQAIGDIQGSIHANDNKSGAGLVVHGLLATAVASLAGRLGSVYDDADGTAQFLIKGSLIAALAIAVVSILCLVWAVKPYVPDEIAFRITGSDAPGLLGRLWAKLPWTEKPPLEARAEYRHLFFPYIQGMKQRARKGGDDELEQVRADFDAVDSSDRLTTEYLAELVEVADIRSHEAKWANRGFVLLGAEIVAVALFLGTVGAVAASIAGAEGRAELEWRVQADGEPRVQARGGQVELHAPARVKVWLEAKPRTAKLEDVRLSVSYRCRATARTRPVGTRREHVSRPASGRHATLLTEHDLRGSCRDGSGKAPSEMLLQATATTEGDHVRESTLLVHAPR